MAAWSGTACGLAAQTRLGYIMQVTVRITPEADAEFGLLPVVMQIRVDAVFTKGDKCRPPPSFASLVKIWSF
jgi:hypothetical protein